MAYATPSDYKNSYPDTLLNDAEITQLLKKSQTAIDVCTNFKIEEQGGIENMPPFAQSQVKKAEVLQAEFIRLYGDLLSGPFSSYGINGISISTDTSRYFTVNGIALDST
ncbi:MAG: hypothetical protein RR198_05145, partial [Oscillospiraceae bacterium]